MSTEQVVEFEIPARLEFLAVVRRLVTAAARARPGWGPERLADLELAVSEACTNAIEAHEAGEVDEPLHVRCTLGHDTVEVTVFDQAQGFPEEPPSGDAPAGATGARIDRERGYGIPLMYLLADEADFSSTGSGTVVRLVLRSRPGRRDRAGRAGRAG